LHEETSKHITGFSQQHGFGPVFSQSLPVKGTAKPGKKTVINMI